MSGRRRKKVVRALVGVHFARGRSRSAYRIRVKVFSSSRAGRSGRSSSSRRFSRRGDVAGVEGKNPRITYYLSCRRRSVPREKQRAKRAGDKGERGGEARSSTMKSFPACFAVILEPVGFQRNLMDVSAGTPGTFQLPALPQIRDPVFALIGRSPAANGRELSDRRRDPRGGKSLAWAVAGS